MGRISKDLLEIFWVSLSDNSDIVTLPFSFQVKMVTLKFWTSKTQRKIGQ